MKTALDTSVLVAAILADHVHHKRAVWWFGRHGDVSLCASWHAMAETWATLTRIPLNPPIASATARQVISRLETSLKLVPPSPQTHREAMRRCSERGLRSGIIFDALHLVTARFIDADILLTFNEADFSRVSEEGDPQILAPPDPPGLPPRPKSTRRRE